MSHITEVEASEQILESDLTALGKAARRLGLVLNIGEDEYRWYGRSVGDSPLPKGFTASDLGKCEHAISIPGNDEAYTIGVVRRRDGKPGYVLHYDFWQGGYGMEAKVGKDCLKLKQAFSVEKAKREARLKGKAVREKTLKDGSIQLFIQT